MPRILVVDDDPAIRDLFARALAELGEVEVAASGFEALRLLGSRAYALVVLDVHMPVVDGLHVLTLLSSKPGPNRDTPVCVVTADTSSHIEAKALQANATFVITKPVRLATLVDLARGIISKSSGQLPKSAAKAPQAKQTKDQK